MLSLCSILSTPVFAQPFLPDNNAGNVNIGNPCVSGAATSPTINCDMYEIEGEDAPVLQTVKAGTTYHLKFTKK